MVSITAFVGSGRAGEREVSLSAAAAVVVVLFIGLLRYQVMTEPNLSLGMIVSSLYLLNLMLKRIILANAQTHRRCAPVGAIPPVSSPSSPQIHVGRPKRIDTRPSQPQLPC